MALIEIHRLCTVHTLGQELLPIVPLFFRWFEIYTARTMKTVAYAHILSHRTHYIATDWEYTQCVCVGGGDEWEMINIESRYQTHDLSYSNRLH